MKNIKLLMIILLSFSVFLAACSSGTGEKEKAAATEDKSRQDEENKELSNPQDAYKDMEKAMEKMKDAQQVDPVNFRELKKIFPEKLAGMTRTSCTGETAGAMGIKVSTAEAKYVKDNAPNPVEMELVDTGGLGFGGVGMAMAAWSTMEIDKEDDFGYERSTTIDGYKAFEQFKYKNKSGEIAILIDGRFILTISADGYEINELKNILKKLDLDAIKKVS